MFILFNRLLSTHSFILGSPLPLYLEPVCVLNSPFKAEVIMPESDLLKSFSFHFFSAVLGIPNPVSRKVNLMVVSH